MVVTVPSESHVILKPSERPCRSFRAKVTGPSSLRLDCLLRDAVGNSELLVLAEVSEPSNSKPEFNHLTPLAQEVICFLVPLETKRGFRLDFEDDRATIHGDRMALFVLLKNLLENALNFAPAGSTVILMLREHALVVRDERTGIDPAHLPHVFKRFWRDPDRRNDGAGLGLGLGLAICQEIASAHGWQLMARTHQPGAEFGVSFG